MGVIEGAISRGQAVRSRGLDLYVDTVNGSNNNDGLSWEQAKATMAAALALATDHSQVNIVGTVAEQIVAPLGVQGVKIVGAAGGNTRHDDGVRWKEAAVATHIPLIRIREQGWEFHNILFVPETGHSAIRAHRAEDATNPDSSHFIVKNCKFVGNVAFDAYGGIGIEDWGGNHHYIVEDCEFHQLAFAIVAPAGSPGIAAPLRNVIRNNRFEGCQNDICMDANRCVIKDNIFADVYHAANHPNTVNLAYLSDVSGRNRVLHNFFADAAADVTIAKGYKPSTGDVWRNYTSAAADPVVAVPV